MPITAWLGALAIGLVLGLLGSGGAIITVPLLVYAAGHTEKQAIAESLAIIGLISLAGTIRAAMKGGVKWSVTFLLGLPGIVGASLGVWASKGISGPVQLLLLAAVMLIATWLMLKGPRPKGETHRPHHPALAALEGFGIGFLTGLIGVGGGFLLVLVMVFLLAMPMHLAIGTSLSIIVLNTASGLLRSFGTLREQGFAIDWRTVLLFSAVGIVGVLVGGSISHRLSAEKLRRVFAVFLIVMAVYMGYRQVHRMMEPAPPVSPAPASVQPPTAPTYDSPRSSDGTGTSGATP
ncbi:MAG TPA: sulfite exporter TauE/SafE family protein [Phycisphaerales bacterium]|nr:sulfite exporter TauE/SafE family protein [Phycisphaerales bacterium]